MQDIAAFETRDVTVRSGSRIGSTITRSRKAVPIGRSSGFRMIEIMVMATIPVAPDAAKLVMIAPMMTKIRLNVLKGSL
jgi:hypothetical protein